MGESAIQEILKTDFAEHLSVFRTMEQDADFCETVSTAAKLLEDTVESDGTIFFCGNGGSAADSQHITTEFVSRLYKERRAIRAEALTVNTSTITAIANDYEYESIFLRQVEAKGRKGDTLVGISTSGASTNVIKALIYAADIGMHTVLLTGRKNEISDDYGIDCIIRVPSGDTARIQEAHIFIGHILAEHIENIVF